MAIQILGVGSLLARAPSVLRFLGGGASGLLRGALRFYRSPAGRLARLGDGESGGSLRFTIKTAGLFDPAYAEAWFRQKRAQIRAGVKRAMIEGGRRIADDMNSQVRGRFKVSRRAFASQFRSKVYDSKPERLPGVLIRSRVAFMGVFTRGGVITGRGKGLLIPLLETRIGRKAFQNVINTIMSNGAGFFKKMPDGRVILFAEYQSQYGRPLARFRRQFASSMGGGRVKKGAAIPIAVLVPQVRLEKRLDLEATVHKQIPQIARLMERYITAQTLPGNLQ